jgi:hypothetical protein
MDIPEAGPAHLPEIAIYRSYSRKDARSGSLKLAFPGARMPHGAIGAALGNTALTVDGKAFPARIVGKIRSYIAGNAIKQDIAYLFGLSAVWGMDCITLHNGIIRDILLEDPRTGLGDRIVGKGSTYEKLAGRGEASGLKTFSFLTARGQEARGNPAAYSLKESAGAFIEGNYRGAGVQIYGVSIHDGYHALTLTYGQSESGSLEYHLIDNGPATSLLTGHRVFKSARELDEALCAYIRRDAVTDYRVGKNKDQAMPARIDIYEIYAPARN